MGMHYFPNRYRSRCFGCVALVAVGAGFARRVAGKEHVARSTRKCRYEVLCPKCKDRYEKLQNFLQGLPED